MTSKALKEEKSKSPLAVPESLVFKVVCLPGALRRNSSTHTLAKAKHACENPKEFGARRQTDCTSGKANGYINVSSVQTAASGAPSKYELEMQKHGIRYYVLATGPDGRRAIRGIMAAYLDKG